MGVSITCVKTDHTIDMGYFGFARLRCKIAELADDPIAKLYVPMFEAPLDMRNAAMERWNQNIDDIIAKRKVPAKLVDFLIQPDCGGHLGHGGCKLLLKIIGDYDDDVAYGYAGRKNCAMFKDFRQTLQECVEHRCKMVWN